MIKASRTEYKGKTFDSKFEMQCYQKIETAIKVNPDICVELQPSVKTHSVTRNYPDRHWKIDFLVIDKHSNKRLYIEAKGHPQSHNRMIDNIKGLDLINPQIHDDLIVVTPNVYNRKLTNKKKQCYRRLLQLQLAIPVIPQKALIAFIIDYFRNS